MKRLTSSQIKELGLNFTEEEAGTTIRMIETDDMRRTYQPRPPHSHKGTMGHALLVSGQYGMAGATILAAKACMRSGVGKLTVHTAGRNNDILQCSVPEAILSHDTSECRITGAIPTADFNAVAIGPGIGTHEETAGALLRFLYNDCKRLVLDADALNLLAIHPDWLKLLPQDTILTPHPKELERLLGKCDNADDRLRKTLNATRQYHIYIILKGYHSLICTPEGYVFVNPTGNAGMATAGSGDVLTGIVCGLLTRGYQPLDAATMGTFLHGLAGDIACEQWGEESMTASDIIDALGEAYKRIDKKH